VHCSADSNELIVLGIRGLIDIIGPRRTFIASSSLNTTSTRDQKVVDAIKLYPSLVRDILHVDSKIHFNSIEIIDTKGTRQNQFSTWTTNIDMSSYTTGTYFFKVNYDGFSQTV
jgi:hypothetical protein